MGVRRGIGFYKFVSGIIAGFGKAGECYLVMTLCLVCMLFLDSPVFVLFLFDNPNQHPSFFGITLDGN
jgi:hypothetical protein